MTALKVSKPGARLNMFSNRTKNGLITFDGENPSLHKVLRPYLLQGHRSVRFKQIADQESIRVKNTKYTDIQKHRYTQQVRTNRWKDVQIYLFSQCSFNRTGKLNRNAFSYEKNE